MYSSFIKLIIIYLVRLKEPFLSIIKLLLKLLIHELLLSGIHICTYIPHTSSQTSNSF